MPRRNHRPVRKQQRHVPPGAVLPRRLRATQAPTPISKMVLPTGRCFFRSRRGKLIFRTEADAQSALRQAKDKRVHQPANGHVECRYYACPDGGCGGFHLTSREEYEERGKTA